MDAAITTDRRGFGQRSVRFRVPPGERELALSVTDEGPDADIEVTPGIYEKRGMSVRVP